MKRREALTAITALAATPFALPSLGSGPRAIAMVGQSNRVPMPLSGDNATLLDPYAYTSPHYVTSGGFLSLAVAWRDQSGNGHDLPGA